MKIDCLTPQGSKINEMELADWKKNAKQFSSLFNDEKENVVFDLESLKILKMEGKYENYITPMWQEHLNVIEELVLKGDFNILDNKLVRYAIYLTIGGEWATKQLPKLKNHFSPDRLKYLLLESKAFRQTIIDPDLQTSESKVNHLTHIVQFEERTNSKISEMSTIVEFGGGYGGMTSLLKKINENLTIIVIDVPVMIILQSYLIKYEHGLESINVITKDKLEIQKGKINYIPISLVSHLSKFNTDLFIATWSLSEANQYTQDEIADKDFFNARYLLYGYRFYDEINPRQPNSKPLPKFFNYDVKFHGPCFWSLRNEQYYLFAKR